MLTELEAVAEMLLMAAREYRKHGNPLPARLAEDLRSIVADPEVCEELRAIGRGLLSTGQA